MAIDKDYCKSMVAYHASCKRGIKIDEMEIKAAKDGIKHTNNIIKMKIENLSKSIKAFQKYKESNK